MKDDLDLCFLANNYSRDLSGNGNDQYNDWIVNENEKRKLNYCTSKAVLGFIDLPLFLFSPIGSVLVAVGGLQYFKRIAIPAACLRI